MTIDGGGFTFAASISEGSDWSFYSPVWTDATVVRPESLDVYNGRKIDRKHASYSSVRVKEIMITNYDGSAYHVMYNFKGDSNINWPSLSAAFGSGGYFLWANRKTSRGGGVWDSSNWALNNAEPDGDRCWEARINVCKQTHVATTGGGTLIGVGCFGGRSRNNNLYAVAGVRTYGSRHAYRCVASGNEPRNLEVPADTYYNIFVR